MKAKWTSRKFLISLSGAVAGILMILTGSRTEGTGMVITSVLGYLVAEGYVDAHAVQQSIQTISGADPEGDPF